MMMLTVTHSKFSALALLVPVTPAFSIEPDHAANSSVDKTSEVAVDTCKHNNMNKIDKAHKTVSPTVGALITT